MMLRLFRSVYRLSGRPSNRAEAVGAGTTFAECIMMIAGAM